MISICIPIFNHPVYPLVQSLSEQIATLHAEGEFEIVCIDDHSSEPFRSQNAPISDIATYILLDDNIGRARIRNLFLRHSKGEWLLFLDNDSEVPNNFLATYRKYLNEKWDVIVGGRIYDHRGDDRQHRLRYLYGTRVESRPAVDRYKHPYKSFMTNNFLIRRSLFEKILFDTRLDHYGHEDTLFGYRLQQNNIPLLHIDNPVVNGYVESNDEFLRKTAEGISSLVTIYRFMSDDRIFLRTVRLLDTYTKLCRLSLYPLVYCLFKKNKTTLEYRFLSGENISVHRFNFYKLGLFIQQMHYNENKETTNINQKT